MIFVLNKNKLPISPCSEATARKLLENKRAVVHKIYPFTIRLKEQKSSTDSSEYRLKIDYGSRHTGIAILRNSEVIWLAQIHHKTTIKDDLESRRGSRRSRRNRHTRYRKPRFSNRRKEEGWLPPSLISRVDNITNFITKIIKLCPITHISYENVKFDTQLMQNPEISGIEYQQGELQGYEVREYLLEKWGRKCVYCGAKDVPLQIEHIIPKARGGTNRVSNLTLACEKCNQLKNTKTALEFGHPEIQKQAKQSLKDAAAVTATRWAVYRRLLNFKLPVECGTGGRTKYNRVKLNLPKDHHFDAICIGVSTPEIIKFGTSTVLHIKARGRGKRQMMQPNKYGFPRIKKDGNLAATRDRHKVHFGIQTGDMVKVNVPDSARTKHKGLCTTGIASCKSAKSGTFHVKDKKVEGLIDVSHKYLKVLQRSDGYEYSVEKLNFGEKVM